MIRINKRVYVQEQRFSNAFPEFLPVSLYSFHVNTLQTLTLEQKWQQ